MDELEFYEFSTKFSETTFMAIAIGSNRDIKTESFSYDILLLSGEYSDFKFPVVFKQNSGSIMRDLLETGTGCLYLISDKLKQILNKAGLTGWKTFPIQLLDKENNEIYGYHGFSVTGRCGPIDYSQSKIEQRQFFEGGPFRKYRKGCRLNSEQWDGTDFFLPKLTFHIIITKKAAKIIKKNKINNISITKLSDIELSEEIVINRENRRIEYLSKLEDV